jgi:hypothetical protein
MDLSEREQLSKLTDEVYSVKIRLGVVEQDLAVIKSNYATKADVLGAKVSIIMWIVSAVLFAQVLPSLFKALSG